jgi:hypothetical protein
MAETYEIYLILDGLPLFSEEPSQEYASHPYYLHFMNMISRSKRRTIACAFTHGRNEFSRWLAIMGRIPEDMKTPSVGRYDHSKGYVFDADNNRWNFRWQDRSENCRESSRSPNHISNTYFTCPRCGITGRGAMWKHHCDDIACGCDISPIQDVIELDPIQ